MRIHALLLAVVAVATIHAQPSFQELEPFVGAYHLANGTVARVMLLKGGLVYRAAGTSTPIRGIDAQTFRGEGPLRSVRVRFSAGQPAPSATISMGSGVHVGQRVIVEPQVLRSYVGTYPLSDTLAMQVTLESGRLHAQAPGASKHPLFPESDTRFFVHDYGTDDVADLEFGREASGAAFVIVSQGGSSQKVARK